MRVDPQRVVELAGRCDEAVERLVAEWAEVGDELRGACDRLGDTSGVTTVAAAYADTLAAADDVVAALAHALEGGVAALVDAARDVSEADETVAFEIGRAAAGHGRHVGWESPGNGPGGNRG